MYSKKNILDKLRCSSSITCTITSVGKFIKNNSKLVSPKTKNFSLISNVTTDRQQVIVQIFENPLKHFDFADLLILRNLERPKCCQEILQILKEKGFEFGLEGMRRRMETYVKLGIAKKFNGNPKFYQLEHDQILYKISEKVKNCLER